MSDLSTIYDGYSCARTQQFPIPKVVSFEAEAPSTKQSESDASPSPNSLDKKPKALSSTKQPNGLASSSSTCSKSTNLLAETQESPLQISPHAHGGASQSESDSQSPDSLDKKPKALSSKKQPHGLASSSSTSSNSTNLLAETQESPLQISPHAHGAASSGTTGSRNRERNANERIENSTRKQPSPMSTHLSNDSFGTTESSSASETMNNPTKNQQTFADRLYGQGSERKRLKDRIRQKGAYDRLKNTDPYGYKMMLNRKKEERLRRRQRTVQLQRERILAEEQQEQRDRALQTIAEMEVEKSSNMKDTVMAFMSAQKDTSISTIRMASNSANGGGQIGFTPLWNQRNHYNAPAAQQSVSHGHHHYNNGSVPAPHRAPPGQQWHPGDWHRHHYNNGSVPAPYRAPPGQQWHPGDGHHHHYNNGASVPAPYRAPPGQQWHPGDGHHHHYNNGASVPAPHRAPPGQQWHPGDGHHHHYYNGASVPHSAGQHGMHRAGPMGRAGGYSTTCYSTPPRDQHRRHNGRPDNLDITPKNLFGKK